MSQNPNKLNIAVVGCGRISQKHFDVIESNKNLKLTAICDTNKNVLEKHMNKYGVSGFIDLEDMLKSNEKIDIVVLCTPSGFHSSQAILISNYKKDIISEKPMATTWNDGLRMVQECKRNKVKLFIVKQNRLNPTLQLLKRAIEDKRFGKINMINVNVFWSRPQKYYDQASWRGTLDLDGGALMNQASHYIDLLTWLNGPISQIQGFASTTLNIETEDTSVLNIRWKEGTLGSVNVTMLTYDKNLEGSIAVLGENGSVIVGGVAVNRILKWKFNTRAQYDKEIERANYDTDSVYGNGHFKYYENVIETLLNNKDADTDGDEGLKSLQTLIAARTSFENNGCTVNLPLSNTVNKK